MLAPVILSRAATQHYKNSKKSDKNNSSHAAACSQNSHAALQTHSAMSTSAVLVAVAVEVAEMETDAVVAMDMDTDYVVTTGLTMTEMEKEDEEAEWDEETEDGAGQFETEESEWTKWRCDPGQTESENLWWTWDGRCWTPEEGYSTWASHNWQGTVINYQPGQASASQSSAWTVISNAADKAAEKARRAVCRFCGQS